MILSQEIKLNGLTDLTSRVVDQPLWMVMHDNGDSYLIAAGSDSKAIEYVADHADAQDYELTATRVVKAFYPSRNLPGKHSDDNCGWSVYSELYAWDSWEGDPINGSEEFVCATNDERTAYRIANALFESLHQELPQ